MPRAPRSLGFALAIWLVASAAAVAAAEQSIAIGLALGVAGGVAFGVVAASRLDARRR